MDINIVNSMENNAIKASRLDFFKIGISLFFIIGVGVFSIMSTGAFSNNAFLVIATIFGAYMAMNIGANDVANNVGPAVGSKALTMLGAIIVAAIFEASGAFIAGGDVISTIKKGIIDINSFGGDTDTFVWAMCAALLSAAMWLNISTLLKAPVSTTHSIVGGVMGAGIAAFGVSVVAWGTMGKIALSWIISPIMGGVIAATFLFSIKRTILFKKDKEKAAKKWVPVYVAIMTWSFVVYLTLKGLKKIWPDIVETLSFLPNEHKPSFLIASLLGIIIACIVFFATKSIISRKKAKDKKSALDINTYFTIPLIFAAALLSFAHGANDVANAIGPLAAINDAINSGSINSSAPIPLWIMAVGALGIALGLALYGPKLIRTVGNEITDLNQTRAFCVAMAASITVIIASQLGLPVSSTHIAIGGIFGIGFLREYLYATSDIKDIEEKKKNTDKVKKMLKVMHDELDRLTKKKDKKKSDYQQIVKVYERIDTSESQLETLQKDLKHSKKTIYIKRGTIKKIVAAWIITVPAAGALSALIFFIIRGIVV